MSKTKPNHNENLFLLELYALEEDEKNLRATKSLIPIQGTFGSLAPALASDSATKNLTLDQVAALLPEEGSLAAFLPEAEFPTHDSLPSLPFPQIYAKTSHQSEVSSPHRQTASFAWRETLTDELPQAPSSSPQSPLLCDITASPQHSSPSIASTFEKASHPTEEPPLLSDPTEQEESERRLSAWLSQEPQDLSFAALFSIHTGHITASQQPNEPHKPFREEINAFAQELPQLLANLRTTHAHQSPISLQLTSQGYHYFFGPTPFNQTIWLCLIAPRAKKSLPLLQLQASRL